MRVLVTGATGFIGHYVVKELLKRGHDVVASSANKDKAVAKEWFDKVSYILFDLGNLNSRMNYYKFFGEPDIMIHLAWEGLPNYKSSFHEEINLPRHLAFLTSLVENGLSDLTVTGTCFEYGMREGGLKENDSVNPVNPYGIAKDKLRRQLEALTAQYRISFKWVRLFYMFGKGQNPNSLLSELDRALDSHEASFNMSGGQQLRDFLPVEKVAEYIVSIGLQKKVSGVINCCSGEPITVQQFVENYLEKKGRQISLNLGYYPYPDYEPMYFWGDNNKLKKIIH